MPIDKSTMPLKVWSMVLSIPLVVQGLFVIQNGVVELAYNITFYNHCQRDTHRIQLYHRVTISDCVTECGLRSHCKAMNYHVQLGLCELFTEVETEFTEDGCTHIKQDDIQVSKMPCVSGCVLGQACDIDTKTCTIKECMSFPDLENGVVIGNRKEVGMKIMTKCVHNYNQRNGIKQTYCTTDGLWIPHVECSRECGILPTPTGAMVVESSGTLEGSETTYACLPGFGHVEGTLTRVCQSDGNWNGTEPTCHISTCTGSGTCYAEYQNKDLLYHDSRYDIANSFEDCSTFCENGPYKSIVHCSFPIGELNCFCKSKTVDDGSQLNEDATCNFYHKL